MPRTCHTAHPRTTRRGLICIAAAVICMGNSGSGGLDMFIVVVILGIVLLLLLGTIILVLRSRDRDQAAATARTKAVELPSPAAPSPVASEDQTRMVRPLPFQRSDGDKTVPYSGDSSVYSDDAPTIVVSGPHGRGYPPPHHENENEDE